jgi:hypothetical protein
MMIKGPLGDAQVLANLCHWRLGILRHPAGNFPLFRIALFQVFRVSTKSPARCGGEQRRPCEQRLGRGRRPKRSAGAVTPAASIR